MKNNVAIYKINKVKCILHASKKKLINNLKV